MRALVVVLGLVLGVLAGAGLILVNPLAWLSGLPPLPADLAPAKAYSWNDYRGIEGGVGDLLGVARRNRDVALMDPTLPHVRIGIVVLPAGEGAPAALAVKVSAVAEENSLWRARLGTDDYWNIFWPGEGSVFANAYSNYWAVARDAFFATLVGGNREQMAPSYPVTAPPPLGEPAGVTGASGRYAGFTGEIREQLYLASPRATRPDPDWAIAIKANPPPVAVP
ncbi:MAG: hypothetical protein ABL989_15145 [Gammaproteobacteria bacterium]